MKPMIITLVAVLSGSILYAPIFTPAIGSIFGNLGNRNEQSIQNSIVLETGDPKSLKGFTGEYARFLDKFWISEDDNFIFLIVITIYIHFFSMALEGIFLLKDPALSLLC